ncbi:sodium-dependent transporter [Salisediminibacterium halotolerans]|uniref:sodium-dependent transporter n=1 Tax=Salisediminibacterium halotolerans TaxID=517425 RepID=UPI000EB5D6C9|nr:sodium-dependent transporter [Salisediminibacterium halotolerans]RLJ75396.1 NSS family neurotransmitter:Na+ symporter [Actinophytocola xinjiangensis]RPE89250.1 NSS family neurotransmitter:Na+ symporter [Salisediminibacterium halotolerans]TWG36009.1 NSS family neurotransmitter:Na+ symporter [Salisediminibacterium halotolerans]GEL07802.1 transporter [Salisediminibacterium halotolerans]
MANGREQWATKLGFILAAVGSAVGLGNIWRFSYVAGESGGAAFLLIYLLCIFLIGLPVLLAEFSIGRKGQADVVGSFHNLAPGKPWVIGGVLGVVTSFLILSFYGVIAGWVLYFLYSFLTGAAVGLEPGTYEGFFGEFIGGTIGPVFWQILFMAFVVSIVYFGVKKGIELANRIFMPLLAIILIMLAGYSLTLEGAGEGLSFLFAPDWTAFADPAIYASAVGQAFFTLSLGMGAMITYSSYLPKETRLPSAAGGVVVLDTLFAIVAGIMIFPAVFTYAVDPADGPGLIFVVLPEVFNEMGTAGTIFAIFFFFLVAIAALSSAISLLEVSVSYVMRKLEVSRHRATLMAGIAVTLLGIPSALSQGGPLTEFTIAGLPFLDAVDTLTDQYTLPLGGLVIALFVGWGWNKVDALQETGLTETAIGNVWIWFIRLIAPIGILWILWQNLFG